METRRCKENSKFIEIGIECRKNIFKLLMNGKSGHIGGSLSCIDILIVIYTEILKNKKNFHFIMSKGHCECGLYAVLIYFNVLKDNFSEFKCINSIMQGHPNRQKIPLLEYSSGSLGQGISFGVGKAIAFKNEKIIVLAGDGEIQEGQVWEALQTCVKYNLNNFILIIDMNHFQLENPTSITGDIYVMESLFISLGFTVRKINGHVYSEIYNSINTSSKTPLVILADTIKGKGISFMENNNDFHGRELAEYEIEKCLNELNREEYI